MGTASKISPDRIKQLILQAESEVDNIEVTIPSATKRRGRPPGSKNRPKTIVAADQREVATILLQKLPDSLRSKLTLDDIVAISKIVSIKSEIAA